MGNHFCLPQRSTRKVQRNLTRRRDVKSKASPIVTVCTGSSRAGNNAKITTPMSTEDKETTQITEIIDLNNTSLQTPEQISKHHDNTTLEIEDYPSILIQFYDRQDYIEEQKSITSKSDLSEIQHREIKSTQETTTMKSVTFGTIDTNQRVDIPRFENNINYTEYSTESKTNSSKQEVDTSEKTTIPSLIELRNKNNIFKQTDLPTSPDKTDSKIKSSKSIIRMSTNETISEDEHMSNIKLDITQTDKKIQVYEYSDLGTELPSVAPIGANSEYKTVEKARKTKKEVPRRWEVKMEKYLVQFEYPDLDVKRYKVRNLEWLMFGRTRQPREARERKAFTETCTRLRNKLKSIICGLDKERNEWIALKGLKTPSSVPHRSHMRDQTDRNETGMAKKESQGNALDTSQLKDNNQSQCANIIKMGIDGSKQSTAGTAGTDLCYSVDQGEMVGHGPHTSLQKMVPAAIDEQIQQRREDKKKNPRRWEVKMEKYLVQFEYPDLETKRYSVCNLERLLFGRTRQPRQVQGRKTLSKKCLHVRNRLETIIQGLDNKRQRWIGEIVLKTSSNDPRKDLTKVQIMRNEPCIVEGTYEGNELRTGQPKAENQNRSTDVHRMGIDGSEQSIVQIADMISNNGADKGGVVAHSPTTIITELARETANNGKSQQPKHEKENLYGTKRRNSENFVTNLRNCIMRSREAYTEEENNGDDPHLVESINDSKKDESNKDTGSVKQSSLERSKCSAEFKTKNDGENEGVEYKVKKEDDRGGGDDHLNEKMRRSKPFVEEGTVEGNGPETGQLKAENQNRTTDVRQMGIDGSTQSIAEMTDTGRKTYSADQGEIVAHGPHTSFKERMYELANVRQSQQPYHEKKESPPRWGVTMDMYSMQFQYQDLEQKRYRVCNLEKLMFGRTQEPRKERGLKSFTEKCAQLRNKLEAIIRGLDNGRQKCIAQTAPKTTSNDLLNGLTEEQIGRNECGLVKELNESSGLDISQLKDKHQGTSADKVQLGIDGSKQSIVKMTGIDLNKRFDQGGIVAHNPTTRFTEIAYETLNDGQQPKHEKEHSCGTERHNSGNFVTNLRNCIMKIRETYREGENNGEDSHLVESNNDLRKDERNIDSTSVKQSSLIRTKCLNDFESEVNGEKQREEYKVKKEDDRGGGDDHRREDDTDKEEVKEKENEDDEESDIYDDSYSSDFETEYETESEQDDYEDDANETFKQFDQERTQYLVDIEDEMEGDKEYKVELEDHGCRGSNNNGIEKDYNDRKNNHGSDIEIMYAAKQDTDHDDDVDAGIVANDSHMTDFEAMHELGIDDGQSDDERDDGDGDDDDEKNGDSHSSDFEITYDSDSDDSESDDDVVDYSNMKFPYSTKFPNRKVELNFLVYFNIKPLPLQLRKCYKQLDEDDDNDFKQMSEKDARGSIHDIKAERERARKWTDPVCEPGVLLGRRRRMQELQEDRRTAGNTKTYVDTGT